MIPIQGLRESTIIAGKDNSNIKEKNKTDIRFKEVSHSFLRKITI